MPHTQEPSFHEAARAKATGLDDKNYWSYYNKRKKI